MAMKFDLVSPERRLASVEATEVMIPGTDGDMTAMAGHAPTITTMRPGIVKAVAGGASQAYAVTGGFAEITASGVTVLAERAVPIGEASASMLDGFIAEARAAVEGNPADRSAAEKYLADMMALRAAVSG